MRGNYTLAVFLAGLSLLSAQAAKPPAVPEIVPEILVSSSPWTLPPLQLSAQTNLVQTDVTVRDLHGNPIAGLQKDNFVISEDGKPRTPTYFSVISAHGATPAPAPAAAANVAASSAPEPAAAASRPRYIALYFDDVNVNAADLMVARRAALRMLLGGLGANDHVCIFTASATEALDCTNAIASLEAAVGRIRPHPLAGGLAPPFCPMITPYVATQIAQFNNTYVMAAVQAECAPQSGNRGFSGPDRGAAGGGRGAAGGVGGVAGQLVGGSSEISAAAEAVWENQRAVSINTLLSLQNATTYLARQLGQRVLLLASDGFLDDDMQDAVQAIIQNALHNDVVINSLDTRGLFTQAAGQVDNDPSGTEGPLRAPTLVFEETVHLAEEQDDEDVMATLAAGTGGYFFHNNNDLQLGFQQLASTPPIVYQLGFPLDVPHDGKYHKLKVNLAPKIKYVTVQARPGFFAPIPGVTVAQFIAAMDNAMRSTDLQSAVPATLTLAQRHLEVDLTARFDVAQLPFLQHFGRSDQKLFITAALFDNHGQLAEGKRGELDLWLLPATRRRFDLEGLQSRLVLYTDRPGPYRLRVVVGESSDARLSTFTQLLQIH